MATQTLNFQKDGSQWIAETTVTGDYNLHIERVSSGSFSIKQRSTDTGQYVTCRLQTPESMKLSYPNEVIDEAFSHGVYPEGGIHIRIVSGSKVTMGVLLEGAQ